MVKKKSKKYILLLSPYTYNLYMKWNKWLPASVMQFVASKISSIKLLIGLQIGATTLKITLTLSTNICR